MTLHPIPNLDARAQELSNPHPKHANHQEEMGPAIKCERHEHQTRKQYKSNSGWVNTRITEEDGIGVSCWPPMGRLDLHGLGAHELPWGSCIAQKDQYNSHGHIDHVTCAHIKDQNSFAEREPAKTRTYPKAMRRLVCLSEVCGRTKMWKTPDPPT